MTLAAIHLGMDDIDSPRGGCTTHFASLLVESLTALGVNWLDYPNLIRLNPNIPFRTRGNGAVALRFSADFEKITELLALTEQMIERYAEGNYPNTNPGVALVCGEVPWELEALAKRALWRTLPITVAQRMAEKLSLDFFTKGNGRGLIGALSAIGNKLSNDHTYEFIAYRPLSMVSEPRGVNVDSVKLLDQKIGDKLFSNIDSSTQRILIEPHGPDPVLYGVRGETASAVVQAARLVKSSQPKERWMIFRTNQGTGEHLQHRVNIADIRPYVAALVEGKIETIPRIIEGGHIIFNLADCTGTIDCAVYEPTGEFRKIFKLLAKGDRIRLHAGVRPGSRTHKMTLNVEGVEILELVNEVNLVNPICPQCNRRMKSAGKNKGYKCTRCGFKDPDAEKMEEPVVRKITVGLYLPPPRAQRHLTRPVIRFHRKNKGIPKDMIENWHHP